MCSAAQEYGRHIAPTRHDWVRYASRQAFVLPGTIDHHLGFLVHVIHRHVTVYSWNRDTGALPRPLEPDA